MANPFAGSHVFFFFQRYATSFDGVSIVDDSSLIHDFYTGECERPVHLVVDTALKVRVGCKGLLRGSLYTFCQLLRRSCSCILSARWERLSITSNIRNILKPHLNPFHYFSKMRLREQMTTFDSSRYWCLHACAEIYIVKAFASPKPRRKYIITFLLWLQHSLKKRNACIGLPYITVDQVSNL